MTSKVALWIGINAIGIVLYLSLASLIWAPPGEKGLLGGPGDPIIWMLGSFPVLVIFFAVDVVWALLIILRIVKKRHWKIMSVGWLIIVALWIAAFYYDGSRHYTGNLVLPDIEQK